MSSFNQFLLWFANENVNFRLPEIQSIIHLFKIKLKWVSGPDSTPFWVVELTSEDALKIASRSITLRSVIKLWGLGNSKEKLHESLKNYPQEEIRTHLNHDSSFRVNVETFGKTFTMQEKVDKIETFNYLPANGPVKLNEPDVNLYYIEYYGLDPSNPPDEPYYLFFGVWICDGQRNLISKYSLKTRKFIGNTSMDPQLSLIMANQALVKEGDLVLDPFVGSGSLLVAAAHFQAYVLGVDIDFLMLHGKSRPTRIQNRSKLREKDESIYSNLREYNRGSQYIDVIAGDSSLPFWHEKFELDSIITDPPYGIREATERIGSLKEYKIKDDHLKTHIPSKIYYDLSQIYNDLLIFAVKHLKMGGRLVSWIPIFKKTYNVLQLPKHPCLKLVSNCEQTLSAQTSRRLLCWEKINEILNSDCSHEGVTTGPIMFRNQYFNHTETRKQRKARMAQELRKEEHNNCTSNSSHSIKR